MQYVIKVVVNMNAKVFEDDIIVHCIFTRGWKNCKFKQVE